MGSATRRSWKLRSALFRGFFGGGRGHVSLEVEVADYLGREVLGDLVKGMAPYAGILTSGANAIFQFGKLAQAASRMDGRA